MKRIAKFHKVSKERFVADWMDAFEGVSADEAERFMRESVFQDGLLPEAQAMISFPRLILPSSQARPSRFRPGSVWRWIRNGC